ncbi:hypothetical protein FRC03_009934 [Tulasnella sp. 419]|nr:hypothetical protein FRC03_009934 [Tulasnella sp. 419]
MNVFALLLAFLILSARIYGQSTEGVTNCNKDSDWWRPLNNPFGRDPCGVALEARRRVVGADQTSIPRNEFLLQTHNGLCTEDAYKLFGACKACQALTQPKPGSAEAMLTTLRDWKACPSDGSSENLFEIQAPLWLSKLHVPEDRIFDVQDALSAVNFVGTVTVGQNTGSSTALAPTITPTLAGTSAPLSSITLVATLDSGTVSDARPSRFMVDKPIVGGIIGTIMVLVLSSMLL